jgi:O-antigen/teichoic acid export membrane protein
MPAFLLLLSRIVTQVSAAVVLILAAHVLGKDEMGVFALASVLTIALVSWIGVGTYEFVLVRDTGTDPLPTAVGLNLVVAAILTAFGLAVAWPAAGWFGTPDIPPVIMALAPIMLPTAVQAALESRLLRGDRIAGMAIGRIACELAALAVGLLLLQAGYGVWALVVQKWVQHGSSAIVLALIARWRPRATLDPALVREITTFGLPILGSRFITFLGQYGADIVIGLVLSPAAVATYRIAARLVQSIGAVVLEPARQISWKVLGDSVRGRGSPADTATSVLRQMAILLVGPLLGLAVCADLVVTVLLGPEWADAAPVVAILAVATLVGLPVQVMEAVLGALDRTRLLLAVRIGTLAAYGVLLALLVRGGPVSVAMAQAAAAVVAVVAGMVLMARIAGIDARRAAGPVATAVAVSAVTFTVVWVLKDRMTAAGFSDLATLATCIAVGGIGYAAPMFMAYRREFGDVARHDIP